MFDQQPLITDGIAANFVELQRSHSFVHEFNLYYIVDSKPSKKKLVELIPHVAPHWYLIGIQLLREDQESLLDVIKADYGHDKVQSCTEMFCLWLKSHPNASWRQLIESLQSPAVQLHSVAADIETMLTGYLVVVMIKCVCF